MEVDSWLRRKFEGRLKEVEVVHREDLDLVGGWAQCCTLAAQRCCVSRGWGRLHREGLDLLRDCLGSCCCCCCCCHIHHRR